MLAPTLALQASATPRVRRILFDRIRQATHNPADLLTPSAACETRRSSPPGPSMTQLTTTTGTDQELQLFETRVDELVTLTMQLREENRALRQRLDGLMSERAALLQKNEQVRARVEAMIGRLKAMEHGA
jgi:cell division protein ZapB